MGLNKIKKQKLVKSVNFRVMVNFNNCTFVDKGKVILELMDSFQETVIRKNIELSQNRSNVTISCDSVAIITGD